MPEAPAPPVLRVALSPAAAERLLELRVRRLLAIELDDLVSVDQGATGPLEGDLIRVWIDTPTPRRALIEVRRGSRSVARRGLAIADFPADVAARVVTIATAEMVRVQARIDEAPAGPSQPNDDGTGQTEDAPFAMVPSLDGMWLPSSAPGGLFGAGFALEHRAGITTQALHTSLLIGEGGGQSLRWLEVGATLGLRLNLAERWRLTLGAQAAGVSLSLPRATTVDGLATSGNEWTARVGAELGLETQLARLTWLRLDVRPGALVRSLDLASNDLEAPHGEVGGFALGLGLGLVASPWQ
ncbi:MAG: hypothetical protein R3B72_02400 [Polyangiaceae bacterium]